MNKDVLSLLVACRQTPSTIHSDIFEEIEKITTPNKKIKDYDLAEYIILKVWNEYDNVIKNLIITLEVKLIDFQNEEHVISSSLHFDLKNKERLEITLFDTSKFSHCQVLIKTLKYQIEQKVMKDFVGGNKFLLNFKDLEDPNAGFVNYYKRMTWFFLINYYLNTLYHRGYLLKMMIEKCKEINKNYHNTKDLSNITFQIVVQIDIISKIMLYTEDLIVFLMANKDNDGFYYNLLDDNDRGNKNENDCNKKDNDLGNKIYDFIQRIAKFSEDDYLKMMGYKIPPNICINDQKLIRRLLNIEIEDIKKLLYKIKIFRDTHIQIFRRYKHAGFPVQIKEDFQSDYPKIECLSLIHVGKGDPGIVLALPFSIDFIKVYEIFIGVIQNFISRILWNKSQSIEKRLDGILPQNIYTDILSQFEKNKLINLINKFNFDNPNYIIRDQLKFTTTLNEVTSPWYYSK